MCRECLTEVADNFCGSCRNVKLQQARPWRPSSCTMKLSAMQLASGSRMATSCSLTRSRSKDGSLKAKALQCGGLMVVEWHCRKPGCQWNQFGRLSDPALQAQVSHQQRQCALQLWRPPCPKVNKIAGAQCIHAKASLNKQGERCQMHESHASAPRVRLLGRT